MAIPSTVVLASVAVNLALAMLADRGVYLPAEFELPLSSLGDFAEAADGSTLVQVSFFQRLQRYSPSGRFLGAWNGLPARVSLLSVTEEGDLTACLRTSLLLFDRNGVLVDRMTTPIEAPVAWRYMGDRRFEAEAISRLQRAGSGGRLHAPAAPRARVKVGDAVCTDWRMERNKSSFERQAGGLLTRQGDRILILDASGRIEGEVASPWYLLWLQLPLPGVPLAALAALLIAVLNWRASRTGPQDE